MSARKPTVVVGMSGGVDSSATAWLLKEQGYKVIGLFMKNWEDDDDDEYCSTREDFVDAAAAADVIGIDFEAVNFAAEYKDRVFADFLREYEAGRTPNPDVLCNAEIKFKAFLDHAVRMGAERIATGHYAGVREVDGRFELLKGADASKDQSYFLHRLSQAQLSRALFPLADIAKSEVRRIAERAGLANHAKKDSTGICFIGERPFREFLNRYLAKKPGPMVTAEGNEIGEHIGLSFYTIGQRKGIGIGGIKESAGAAWYVAQKDVANNRLVVVQGHDHPLLLQHELRAQQASWIAGLPPEDLSEEPPQTGIFKHALTAKTRYRQAGAPAMLHPAGGGEFTLSFDHAQWAVTPGQSAVLYRGSVCLGGGIITA